MLMFKSRVLLLVMLIILCFPLTGCIPEPPGKEELALTMQMYQDMILLKDPSDFGFWDYLTLPHRGKVILAGDLHKILDEVQPGEEEPLNLILYVYDDYGRGDMILKFAERDLTYHNINKHKVFSGSNNLLYNLSYILNLPAKICHNLYWDVCFAMHPTDYYKKLEKLRVENDNNKKNDDIVNYILGIVIYVLIIVGKILLAIYFIILDVITVIIGLVCAIVMLIFGTLIGLLYEPVGTFVDLIPCFISLLGTILHAVVYIFTGY